MDRNINLLIRYGGMTKSLSARRAWIEISARLPRSLRPLVALRKESVDRNVPLARPKGGLR